jgi:OmpA-OmpF porin, OOP family
VVIARKDFVMRKTGFLVSTLIIAGVGAVTGAATAAPPSVDANCALYGECKVDSAVEAPVAAEPPAATTSGPRVRTSATRGFSMAGSTPAAPPVTKQGKPAVKLATVPDKKMGTKTAVATVRPKTVQAMQAAEAIRAAQLITFRSGSADLTSDGTAIARQIAAAMLRPDKANMRFSLEGHTDAVGSKALNDALSQRRANALAAYLVGMGISPTRLTTTGYGYDRPLSGLPSTSPANRRVEVKPVN